MSLHTTWPQLAQLLPNLAACWELDTGERVQGEELVCVSVHACVGLCLHMHVYVSVSACACSLQQLTRTH